MRGDCRISVTEDQTLGPTQRPGTNTITGFEVIVIGKVVAVGFISIGGSHAIEG